MTAVLRADTALFNRKMNEEMRTMAVRMGKKLCEMSNHLVQSPLLKDWLGHIERKETPGMYPIGLGLLFAELGLPNYEQTGYVGIMVTGGTPAPIIAKLNASINEVLREPEFAKKFTALGYDMVGGTVEGFGKFLKDDMEFYRRLTQAAGLTPE